MTARETELTQQLADCQQALAAAVREKPIVAPKGGLARAPRVWFQQ
jgi:hypothetical protein